MTRGLTSAAHRYSEALGRSGWREQKPDPPPKPRRVRVRVEPKKPSRRQPSSKLLTATEHLTLAERQIVRGCRLSVGGPAAEQVRDEIEREVRRR
jgi:hypothetical protein